MNRKKVTQTLPVLLWMVLIFFFSHQAAADSSEASGRLAYWLSVFMRSISSKWNPGQQAVLMDIIVTVLRKGAHMAAYFMLTILAFYAASAWISKALFRYLAAFGAALLYSISDEIHQLFIPGRSGELRDVLIDMAGGLIALLLILMIRKIRGEREARHNYLVTAAVLVVCIVFISYGRSSQLPDAYTAEDFGFETLTSDQDMDGDGIDDYTDLMQGARAYLATCPQYKSAYYEGGYPNDGYGVCADVLWYAFNEAGYDLKAMVDADIEQNTDAYANISKPDPNIDFRRVTNLDVFFERNLEVLTTDRTDASQWQPGDILTFSRPGHVAICSDKRNEEGIPFIIHLNYTGGHEDDDMDHYSILGHYRLNLN